MELRGRAAIVTGASSDDGIGSECAKMLASRGCNVIVNYASNKAGGEKVAEACREFAEKNHLLQEHGVIT